jgi:hypothetical protein
MPSILLFYAKIFYRLIKQLIYEAGTDRRSVLTDQPILRKKVFLKIFVKNTLLEVIF